MPVTQKKALQRLADCLLKAPKESVVILAGAGISVAAGIPDFRSKGTGLYSQLERYRLPTPTSMFELAYYCLRPRPFSSLSMSIFPSYTYKPTLTHHFFRLLEQKGLLRFIYTQNIDELETLAGISPSKMLQCHGSYCKGLFCVGALSGVCSYRVEEHMVFRAAALDGAVAHCPQCGRVMKPNIVFFGEQLPSEFQLAPDIIRDENKTKVLIILGTSLLVAPFNYLSELVPKGAMRVLVNRAPAGYVMQALNFYCNDNPGAEVKDIVEDEETLEKALDYTERSGLDLFFSGDIDPTIEELADLMGYKAELVDLRDACNKKLDLLLEQERAEAKEAESGTADSNIKMLTPIFYTNSLQVPISISLTTRTSAGKELHGMLGFSTPAQVALLQELAEVSQESLTLDLQQLPLDLAAHIRDIAGIKGDDSAKNELIVQWANYTNPVGSCVYAPLNCHWASYCHSFVGLIGKESSKSDKEFTHDVWDLVTRWSKSMTSNEDCVEDNAADSKTSYRDQNNTNISITHFVDYSVVPCLTEQTFTCTLLANGECTAGIIKSSPLSRHLAGAGDKLKAGKVLTNSSQANKERLEYNIIPTYSDQIDEVFNKLQKRVSSLTEDLRLMVKPYLVFDLTFQSTENDVKSLVYYRSFTDNAQANVAAKEAILSSLTTLVKRSVGSYVKKIVPVTQ